MKSKPKTRPRSPGKSQVFTTGTKVLKNREDGRGLTVKRGVAKHHVVRGSEGSWLEIADYPKLKAIKCMCAECLGWETDPKDCERPHCPLFPYRGRTFASKERK